MDEKEAAPPASGFEEELAAKLEERFRAQYVEPLKAKISELEKEAAYLKGRTERDAIEEDPRLPKTEREWEFALEVYREKAEADEEKFGEIYHRARDLYSRWQKKQAEIEAERTRKAAEFEKRLQKAGISEESREYRVAKAAWLGGLPAEEIEALVAPKKETGGRISPGNAAIPPGGSGGPPPGEKKDPSRSFADSIRDYAHRLRKNVTADALFKGQS